MCTYHRLHFKHIRFLKLNQGYLLLKIYHNLNILLVYISLNSTCIQQNFCFSMTIILHDHDHYLRMKFQKTRLLLSLNCVAFRDLLQTIKVMSIYLCSYKKQCDQCQTISVSNNSNPNMEYHTDCQSILLCQIQIAEN